MPHKTAVIALGGNAIGATGKEDIHQQFANTRQALAGFIELIREGYNLAITHGNGPQVGNALLRVERTFPDGIPALPLGVIVADTEGGMGYMIEQSLQNLLAAKNIDRQVVTLVTQVVVDRDDPSIRNPSKPIGPYYKQEEVEALKARGWVVKDDARRGFRRFVPSPIPKAIVNKKTIKQLVQQGTIVIAGGGGGVPVCIQSDGSYEGMDAVIDKDRASAVLARDIAAETLMILTAVEKVSLNYKKPGQQDLSSLTMAEAKKYLTQGQFAAGSMGPKIEAAIQFLEYGGKQVIITSLDKAAQALKGQAGTRITA
ncbi:carbamate kinase [candidate division TA06 bacterium]|uniref:Carbamate kinase n=1 Tax=candidate division TA06 bacterium TaxID=2250710 RepID=A0A933I7V0_UNCT6|nr:carbamate kinase [candidate division TA06 bacterium]